MNKKNLYKEEENSDDQEEEEEEEEDEEENEEEEIVDYGDLMSESITEDKSSKIESNQEQEGRVNTAVNAFEKQIKDKVDLLDLDLESMPKDDLINLLLKTEEEPPKKKFKFNPRKDIKEVKSSNTITNVQQMSESKDPELSQDFNVALTKILAKMVKDSNNENQEVFDILLADREKVEEELRKYEFAKHTNIGEKVKQWIDKKNRSLEVIQEKLDDDFQKVHTFAPNVASSKTSMIKRNFDQFLEDQDNHTRKIKEKLDLLRDTKMKEITTDNQTAPKINVLSRKIAEEKFKTENVNQREVYDRLYNQRTSKINNPLKQSPSVNSKNFNVSKKLEERTKILYQDAINRQAKQKEKLIKNKNENIVNIKSTENSNKYFFRKFKSNFRDEVEKLLQEILNMTNDSQVNKLNFNHFNALMTNLNFMSRDNNNVMEDEYTLGKDNSNCLNANPLSIKNQEKRLLVEMYENLKDQDGFVNLDHLFIFCLSNLNLLEYFVVRSYKNEENLNQNFNLNPTPQKKLKSAQSNKNIIKKTNSTLNINDDAYQNLVHKLNLELASRIIVQKKYGGLDEENNFIITFTHAKLIFKDFNLLLLNYKNSIHKSKTNKQNEEEFNFKPKLNTNTKAIQMGDKFRQKMINEIENSNTGGILNELNPNAIIKSNDRFFSPSNRMTFKSPTRTIDNANYLDVLKKKKIQKEKLNEKLREEREMKELQNCTFKPKINNYQFKDNIIPIDNFQKEQRLEILYKKGTETLINKKNKTHDDFDVEKNGSECTFKPYINNDRELEVVFDDNRNQIILDKDVQKFNERMKRGRIDREIKESANRRGEDIRSPPQKIKSRNKSENKTSSGQISKTTNAVNEVNRKFNQYLNQNMNVNTNTNTNISNQTQTQNLNQRESQNNLPVNNVNALSTNNFNNTTEKSIIPLLIIDVNIRPGEKRQITVYEGDTADKLATNFSTAHGLDNNTRNKLQTLIQSQLNRVLSKIVEEENNSVKSEKSNGFS